MTVDSFIPVKEPKIIYTQTGSAASCNYVWSEISVNFILLNDQNYQLEPNLDLRKFVRFDESKRTIVAQKNREVDAEFFVLAQLRTELSDQVTEQTSEIMLKFTLPPGEVPQVPEEPAALPEEEEEPIPVFHKSIDPPKFAQALQSTYEIVIEEDEAEGQVAKLSLGMI